MSSRHRFLKKRSVKTGLPPGSLVHIGSSTGQAATLELIRYSSQEYREQHLERVEELQTGAAGIVWLNVEGIHDLELVRRVGDRFGLHPLVLEDVVSTVQRPKIEDYGDYLFIVLRMLRPQAGEDFSSEQISVILGRDWLVTFQEGITGDLFDPLRERIRTGKGKVRSMGADYLAYSLLDAVIDGYFGVLEELGERIIDLEERLTLSPERGALPSINQHKKEIIYLRKAVWPLREAVSTLERGDSNLLSEATRLYFRDLHDHTVQVIETVETYRDLLGGMLDLYLSGIGNRTNEVMKFLTVIGTIFLPLTFLVGVYGMNFKYMPELNLHYGYYALWVFMLVLSAGMIILFKRKKWL